MRLHPYLRQAKTADVLQSDVLSAETVTHSFQKTDSLVAAIETGWTSLEFAQLLLGDLSPLVLWACMCLREVIGKGTCVKVIHSMSPVAVLDFTMT